MSGSSTVFSGESTDAVSAMKCTPQNAITSASVFAACCESAERVADEVGHVLDLGQLVVVREDHGAALGGQRAYLGLQGRHGFEREQVHWTVSKISDRSRTGAEWVSAPIET